MGSADALRKEQERYEARLAVDFASLSGDELAAVTEGGGRAGISDREREAVERILSAMFGGRPQTTGEAH